MAVKYFSVHILGGSRQKYSPPEELIDAKDDDSALEIADKEFESEHWKSHLQGYVVLKLVAEITK